MKKEPAKTILLLDSGAKLFVRDPYQSVQNALYCGDPYLDLIGTEGNPVCVAVSHIAALLGPVKD